MISELGVVCRILNRNALVRIQKSSACAHCESRDSCEFSDKEILVEVLNDLEAKVGDQVEVSLLRSSLLKLSLLVYLFPVAAFVGGAYAGSLWAAGIHQSDGNLSAILGGVLAMGIAFYILKYFDRTALWKEKYFPRMTRIVISAVPPEPDDSI